MPASILDLPTELILEIIHSNNSTDATVTIACLGMTCRRLRNICQVLVLERQLPVLRALVRRRRLFIYKNSGSIAMKDEDLDDVKEIYASFHKIKYAPVTFTVQDNASVHGLIFHANTVGHININLDLLAEEENWYKPLASLIRVSSEKNMAGLTIRALPHSYFTPLPIPKTPSSPVKNYLSILSRLKDRFFAHKTRSPRPGGIGSTRQVGAPERERLPNFTGVCFSTPRGLKSFEIDSPLPFRGACLPETLQALNGGYLIKLSLLNTRLYMSDWSHILPLLSMPLLSEFNVGDSDIAFRDLSPFLLRHSSITHLDLSCSSPIGPIVPQKGFLPCLEVITGNPDYLSGLLSGRRHLFPHLRSVVVRHSPNPIHWQDKALDDLLRSLADRKGPGTIHLSIQFFQLRWISKAKLKSLSLDCVIESGFPISSQMYDSFFSWLPVKFPYVQELDLTWVVPPDPNMWTWRLDVLWDFCPELQSIIVREKTYQRPAKAVQ
ncbi:uncharacterized protein LACBIDRAFT_330846 [Laccaria bicolor S238N-H82]|uniref:Predicted protein n=1 Tax=Laccaria bicolor (strain S238N-H82 / ATCC MYA-4686) TaxID=486041 RepID=B0DMN7_LACBS|nr:uncharacterized protein LACBIDRAFT_330846 [Laccaria bicolor S238N-H82]EDR04220.1 predicted protein [Laccaria bicolor S238N-H82]|eukprot:XP_001885111.1 predicted protein [Laccaria bicolor S238N-H82]